jgi:hypothetical protein
MVLLAGTTLGCGQPAAAPTQAPSTSGFSLEITVIPPEGGKVDPGPGRFAAGQVVKLTPQPSAGYKFVAWSGDVTGDSATFNLTMDGNKKVSATFIKTSTFNLTTAVNPPNSGTANPAGTTSYAAGQLVVINAEAAPGWQFSSWSGDVSGTDPTARLTLDRNRSVTANFVPSGFGLTVSIVPPRMGKVTLSPAPSGNPTGNPDDSATYQYPSGAEVKLSAAPALGYEFGGWSGDITGSASTAGVTITAAKKVVATFRQQNTRTVTLTIKNPRGGKVSLSPPPAQPGVPVPGDPDTQVYSFGANTSVALNVTTELGYRFKGWTGAVNDPAASVSVTLDSDRALTATFETATQELPFTLAATTSTVSYLDFSGFVPKDEKITGGLQWELPFTSGTWDINITGPAGNSVLHLNKADQKSEFTFTPAEAGQYRIRVANMSEKLMRGVLSFTPALFKLQY